MLLFWAWVLLAFDVWALIFEFIELCQSDNQKIYEKFHFMNKICIPYFITRIIWGFRIFKYGHLFLKNSSENNLIPGILFCVSMFEIVISLFTIAMLIIDLGSIFICYYNSLKYGKRCPLNLFLKTYKILDYSADNYNIRYHNEDINFSFIPHLIVCELLYKEKSKKRKNDKKREIKESQKELYSMMIKDLQKIQKEEETKAEKYFSQARQNAENIQKRLDNR